MHQTGGNNVVRNC